MKLEVVPLPEKRVGEATAGPYLLIISEATPDWLTNVSDSLYGIKDQIGADGILVFEETVEVVK